MKISLPKEYLRMVQYFPHRQFAHSLVEKLAGYFQLDLTVKVLFSIMYSSKPVSKEGVCILPSNLRLKAAFRAAENKLLR